jgi:hypothetical protein
MALSVAQANAVSSLGYDKTLTQIVYQDSPLFVKLKQDNRIKQEGGTDIRRNINYTSLSLSDAVDPDSQVTWEARDTITTAVWNWKYYLGRTRISWKERRENTGKFKIVNLIEAKSKELKDDFYKRFATDLYTNNPNGNGMDSINTIIDSTTACGGIAVTDATTWLSTESISVTLTLNSGTNSLAYMVSQATFGKDQPQIHITTRDLWNTFEALMIGNVRYEDEKMANAGFTNITYRGKPVVADPHCLSGDWYGIDTNAIELVVHPDDAFKVSQWEDATQMGFPQSMIKYISAMLQLVTIRRNTHFKYTALVYTNQ